MDGPGARGLTENDPAYVALIERLYALSAKGVKLGLDRVEAALGLLGSPQDRTPAIHIAGSNGKGSTAAFSSAILSAWGPPRTDASAAVGHHSRPSGVVGLFTSPHLVSLTERVAFIEDARRTPITHDGIVAAVAEVERVAPGFGELTFFEVLTCAMFVAFEAAAVDLAVIEAGLGARLDATRLARAEVSVLTTVSLEHTSILGDTLEAIAKEKVAVARPGRPLVFGGGAPEVQAVVEAAARDIGSPLLTAGLDFYAASRSTHLDFHLADRVVEGVELSLPGAHQIDNGLVAAQAAVLFDPTLTDAAIRRGLAHADWPGRGEVRIVDGVNVILDGAHNPSAVRTLAAVLGTDRFFGPKHFVVAAMADKDLSGLVSPLAPLAASWTWTQVEFRRAAPAAQLLGDLASPAGAIAITDPEAALAAALGRARKDGGWVVVTGSLHLVGAVQRKVAG